MTVAEDLDRYATYIGEDCIYWERPWNGKRPTVGAHCHIYIKTGMSASRAVYIVSTGGNKLPSSSWVLHTCGRGEQGCVNPGHLYLGTGQDNANDRLAHSNSPIGTRNGKSKLLESDVLEIRSLLAQWDSDLAKTLAQHYGVSVPAIRQIYNRKVWKHI